MLSFDLRDLDIQAANVHGALAADDPIWEESDPRPAGPVRVTGRLSRAGAGRFYFHGSMEGTVAGECRRCLTDVEAAVKVEDAHLIFAEEGLDEGDDESDAYLFDPGERSLDLRPAIREEWLLAAPAFLLCREDCRGLCPKCGADLNEDPQHAHADVDPRWSALLGSEGEGPRESH
jgi:uncharacterized protein